MDSRPLATGRDCEVHALGEGRVVRRYTDGRSAGAEAALQQALHALGYPVPRVEEWDGPAIVMARVDGPTLGAQLMSGAVPIDDGARMLAGLQGRLHALPWPGGESLLHLDLHPFNVMLGADGPVVIDWTDARPGPPGLDVAMSAVMLAGVALTGEFPEADAFLTAYAGVAPAAYVDHLDAAAGIRTAKPYTTAAEREVMAEAVALALRRARCG